MHWAGQMPLNHFTLYKLQTDAPLKYLQLHPNRYTQNAHIIILIEPIKDRSNIQFWLAHTGVDDAAAEMCVHNVSLIQLTLNPNICFKVLCVRPNLLTLGNWSFRICAMPAYRRTNYLSVPSLFVFHVIQSQTFESEKVEISIIE